MHEESNLSQTGILIGRHILAPIINHHIESAFNQYIVSIYGLENLEEAHISRQQLLFCSNHLRPQTPLHEKFLLVEDGPLIKGVIDSYLGTDIAFVMKCDSGNKLYHPRSSKSRRKVQYSIQEFGRSIIFGSRNVPVQLNKVLSARQTFREFLFDFDSVVIQHPYKGGALIFPEGKWTPDEGFKDNSFIHKGAAFIARRHQMTIIPTYIMRYEKNHMGLIFGKPLIPGQETNLDILTKTISTSIFTLQEIMNGRVEFT